MLWVWCGVVVRRFDGSCCSCVRGEGITCQVCVIRSRLDVHPSTKCVSQVTRKANKVSQVTRKANKVSQVTRKANKVSQVTRKAKRVCAVDIKATLFPERGKVWISRMCQLLLSMLPTCV
jgi:hypothetical protein